VCCSQQGTYCSSFSVTDKRVNQGFGFADHSIRELSHFPEDVEVDLLKDMGLFIFTVQFSGEDGDYECDDFYRVVSTTF